MSSRRSDVGSTIVSITPEEACLMIRVPGGDPESPKGISISICYQSSQMDGFERFDGVGDDDEDEKVVEGLGRSSDLALCNITLPC